MDRDTLVISNPAQMAAARDLAAIFASGMHRDPRMMNALGGVSYSRFAPKRFMHPAAARQLGDAARQHLGGQFARDDVRQMLFNSPTLEDVHVDAVLTNISVMYVNDMYIGPMVFPRVQVTKESDVFFVYDREDFLRNEAKVRPPSTRAQQGGYGLSTSSYKCHEYSFEKPIDDRIRRNSDNPLNPDRDATIYTTDKIDMAVEQLVQTAIETSGNWTTNATLSGTDQWSDFANSDPFDDVKTARLTVLKQIARKANTGVLSIEVFETLALHPDLLDRVKYTGTGERPAMVTAQMMAELFGLDQILVGSAVEDTATEGAAASIGYVWGKHFWIGHVPSAPSLNTPAAGYTFTTGRMVDRYREEAITSDVVRAREALDVQPVAAGAGYRIVNAIG